jgi:hypothetical protein
LLVTPGAYPEGNPRGKHLKGPLIGFALALPSNSKTRLERVSKAKPSSLLGLVISNEEKKFYNIDARVCIGKTLLSMFLKKFFKW